jgi:hypothetical protein
MTNRMGKVRKGHANRTIPRDRIIGVRRYVPETLFELRKELVAIADRLRAGEAVNVGRLDQLADRVTGLDQQLSTLLQPRNGITIIDRLRQRVRELYPHLICSFCIYVQVSDGID